VSGKLPVVDLRNQIQTKPSSEWLLPTIIGYYLVNVRSDFSNVNAQLSHDGDNIKGRDTSQALPNQRWVYKA
jgi:hypothetical protein